MADLPSADRLRREAAILIGAAMLVTFVVQRLYLHLIDPNSDLFIAGYNIHHLFTGALIEIPAAIILALGVGGKWIRRAACLAFGLGSAMVLDEVVYLITTDGSNAAYLTPVSLWGAIVLIGIATLSLAALYFAKMDKQ